MSTSTGPPPNFAKYYKFATSFSGIAFWSGRNLIAECYWNRSDNNPEHFENYLETDPDLEKCAY